MFQGNHRTSKIGEIKGHEFREHRNCMPIERKLARSLCEAKSRWNLRNDAPDVPSEVHSPRTGGRSPREGLLEETRDLKELKRPREGNESRPETPAGILRHREPPSVRPSVRSPPLCLSLSLSLSLATCRIRGDSRGRNKRQIADRCPYAPNDRLKVHYGAVRDPRRDHGVRSSLGRHLRELEKGSADYST